MASHVEPEGDLTLEQALQGEHVDQRLLLSILNVLVRIHNRLPERDVYDPVFSPLRVTLAAGEIKSFERGAPYTDWIISVETTPAAALLNVYWSEAPGMQPHTQLAAGDVTRFPAVQAHLVLENPTSGNCVFTLIEVY
jgi:hypothetical protein